MKFSGFWLEKIEEKKTTKEDGATTTYKAIFETPNGDKITISQREPFEGLVVGEKYDIKITSPQTTLDSMRGETE